MLKILSYIFCVITVYIYIYAPAFTIIPFGLDKVILLLTYIYITYKKEWHLVLSKFKNELLILTSIFVFSSFVSYLHWKSTFVALYDFLLLFQVIPCAYALFRYFENGEGFRLDKTIINCSVIASLITFYLILNPEISYYFKSTLLKYPEDMVDKFYYRGYGLSDGLLFAYPVIQGFCLSFILLGFFKNPIYFLFIVPISVSVFTNARSGLVPIFIALMIIFLSNTKYFLKISIIITVITAFLLNFISNFLDNNLMLNTAFEWGMSTFDIIGAMLSGEKTENFEVLLDDMIVLPEIPHEWLIGSGDYIFTNFANTTDIGYLLRLNYGGIIYLLLFILLPTLMFMRLKKINLVLSLLVFISLLYLNFKGDFFIVNPSSRFFFLVYVICILNHAAFKKESEIALNAKLTISS